MSSAVGKLESEDGFFSKRSILQHAEKINKSKRMRRVEIKKTCLSSPIFGYSATEHKSRQSVVSDLRLFSNQHLTASRALA